MHVRTRAVLAACLTGGLALGMALPADAAITTPSAAALELARQPLAPNDGWAAAGAGTTGGSVAAVVLGSGALAERAFAYGADKVYVVGDPALAPRYVR